VHRDRRGSKPNANQSISQSIKHACNPGLSTQQHIRHVREDDRPVRTV